MSLRTLIEEVLTDIATDWVDHENRIVGLRSDVDTLESGGSAADLIDDSSSSTSKTYSSSKIDGLISGVPRTVIDDTAASTTKVYSSSKVESVASAAGNAAATALINDSAASSSKTYSSNKIASLISAAVTNLVNGSPAALDTLKELSDALGGDANFATTVTTAIGNRVRFDTSQALTSTQKAQALANIGAIAAADVGDVTSSLVTVYQNAKS